MKKFSKGEIWFYVVLIISVLMVNPPILGIINRYCEAHLLTFSFSTMWLWLEFWFTVMTVDFVIAALKIKRWSCWQDNKPIEPVERERL